MTRWKHISEGRPGPQTAVGEVCFAGLGALDRGVAVGKLSRYLSVPVARGARGIRIVTALFAAPPLPAFPRQDPQCHPLTTQ